MRELQAKLLRRALEIAGSRAELAARLNVEEHAVGLWVKGRATAPDRVFQALVDLVLQDDIDRAAQDRRRAPREAAERTNPV
ncbi:MAG TPA: hypothetical protein VFB08_04585 [Burkholderiales bacterium]|nr:hypothetical protein [Burkholderiales bacterium]